MGVGDGDGAGHGSFGSAGDGHGVGVAVGVAVGVGVRSVIPRSVCGDALLLTIAAKIAAEKRITAHNENRVFLIIIPPRSLCFADIFFRL